MEKLAFVFTGQGAQYVGMGKSFFDDYAIVRQTYEEASDVLGFDLAKLCFDGTLAELTKTENTQPALLATCVAIYRAYIVDIGIPAHFCSGHSLGEYTALTCAGAIKFSDAVKIVRQRGLLTKKIVDLDIGAMTIVDNIDRQTIEAECKKESKDGQFVIVNCYNSPTQFSIAGHKTLVEKVESNLLDLGAMVTPLYMSAPFHCSLMQSTAEKLREELEKYTFYPLKYPVISNVTGLPYGHKEDILNTLTLQIQKPVQWQATMEYLKKFNISTVIEIGPKNILANLVKSSMDGIEAYCYGQKEDRNELVELLSTHASFKNGLPSVVSKCLTTAATTRNENWNNDEYQRGVVEPYRKIEQIQAELDKTGGNPSLEQMEQALSLLKIILNTKKVPVEEQMVLFHQIFDETHTYYMFKDFNPVSMP